MGNEYSRTIEPARAIATETLTLTRTLSDLVNHACAGNDEPRLPGLRAFKYCVVFRVALYNLKDTGDFYERVKAHSRGQLMRLIPVNCMGFFSRFFCRQHMQKLHRL